MARWVAILLFAAGVSGEAARLMTIEETDGWKGYDRNQIRSGFTFWIRLDGQDCEFYGHPYIADG